MCAPEHETQEAAGIFLDGRAGGPPAKNGPRRAENFEYIRIFRWKLGGIVAGGAGWTHACSTGGPGRTAKTAAELNVSKSVADHPERDFMARRHSPGDTDEEGRAARAVTLPLGDDWGGL